MGYRKRHLIGALALCLENSDCAPYGFCILGTLWDRRCPSVESPGRCAPVLPTWEQCVASEPVCGCDGLSYGGMCRISFASTDLRAKGLCKEPRYSCEELIAGFDADIALLRSA